MDYEVGYKKLSEFTKEHANLPQMNLDSKQELWLYYWCERQKWLYKNGELLEIQIEQLNNISSWSWEINDKLYINMLNLTKWLNKNSTNDNLDVQKWLLHSSSPCNEKLITDFRINEYIL
jgi:hypothetical protein